MAVDEVCNVDFGGGDYHGREPDNLERLVTALTAPGAYDRERAERKPIPTPSHLAGPDHHLLMTQAGPLDLLGAVTKGRGYRDLLGKTVDMEIRPGLRVKVLDLAAKDPGESHGGS